MTKITVAEYLNLINTTLSTIPSEEITIIGEIVDFRISQGKWINFDLKDEKEEAKVSCFMTSFQLKTAIDNGMKVEVVGSPKVYERFGRFSLNVRDVQPIGEGALARAYQLLKDKLEREGLFDLSRKRPLPKFPSKIGLITSSEAAAYGDFMRILNNRWGGIAVIHANVHVQGKLAIPEIVQAFANFNSLPDEEKPEVLVLTRGGGSLEDLHAFNDEAVARAVFTSKIPVIVAVGHERDESLADFVADVRASTPSNAAERIVPNREDLILQIERIEDRLHDQLVFAIERKQRRVDNAMQILHRYIDSHAFEVRQLIARFNHAFDRFRLSLVSTHEYIQQKELRIDTIFSHYFNTTKSEVLSLERVLKQFDVQNTLNRGFSILKIHGKIVRDAKDLKTGDTVEIQLSHGHKSAIIE
jgi:exodeoxyribonuclease VII large subunit